MNHYYPAEIVAVDQEKAVACIQATGHRITFYHAGAYPVPHDLRVCGAKGYVSFPKAPPVFTAQQELSATTEDSRLGELSAAA